MWVFRKLKIMISLQYYNFSMCLSKMFSFLRLSLRSFRLYQYFLYSYIYTNIIQWLAIHWQIGYIMFSLLKLINNGCYKCAKRLVKNQTNYIAFHPIETVNQPVTWRCQLITAVIQLLLILWGKMNLPYLSTKKLSRHAIIQLSLFPIWHFKIEMFSKR